jgi:hypothetical protein
MRANTIDDPGQGRPGGHILRRRRRRRRSRRGRRPASGVLAVATVVGLVAVASIAGASTPPVVDTVDDVPEGAELPDIIEETPKHLGIQNAHQREILRFSTTHWNFGDGPLQVHGGGQVAPCEIDGVAFDQCTVATQEILDADGEIVATHPAGVSVFHTQHNHWHQDSVALFAVRATPDGPPVTEDSVLKTTFCLVDLDKSDLVERGADRVYWECNGDLQGISVGWGDEYHHSTEGQSLDITGLPAGEYYLTMEGDPDDQWIETDETNNVSWVRFRLDRTGANPKVTVLESFGYEGNTSNK